MKWHSEFTGLVKILFETLNQRTARLKNNEKHGAFLLPTDDTSTFSRVNTNTLLMRKRNLTSNRCCCSLLFSFYKNERKGKIFLRFFFFFLLTSWESNDARLILVSSKWWRRRKDSFAKRRSIKRIFDVIFTSEKFKLKLNRSSTDDLYKEKQKQIDFSFRW